MFFFKSTPDEFYFVNKFGKYCLVHLLAHLTKRTHLGSSWEQTEKLGWIKFR